MTDNAEPTYWELRNREIAADAAAAEAAARLNHAEISAGNIVGPRTPADAFAHAAENAPQDAESPSSDL